MLKRQDSYWSKGSHLANLPTWKSLKVAVILGRFLNLLTITRCIKATTVLLQRGCKSRFWSPGPRSCYVFPHTQLATSDPLWFADQAGRGMLSSANAWFLKGGLFCLPGPYVSDVFVFKNMGLWNGGVFMMFMPYLSVYLFRSMENNWASTKEDTRVCYELALHLLELLRSQFLQLLGSLYPKVVRTVHFKVVIWYIIEA